MRIVSWNCCGKFREKFTKLTELDADIYVIQECENPETATHQEYKKFAENALWQGYTPSRGLGVFPRSSLSAKQLGWENCLLRHFMPVAINGLTLLAVWACRPYIEEYAIYQAIHYDKFNSEMVVIGDLNSNKIWDKKSARIPSGRSHSDVVSRLAQKGLCSAYHYINGENQGEETRPTFYMHRNKNKPYHIDYCFIDPNKMKDFSIPDSEYWLQYSDHVPIILDTIE